VDWFVGVAGIGVEGRARGEDHGGLNSFRPVGDERGRDAAFVDPVLVFSEGGVGDVGPIFSVSDFSLGEAGHDSFAPAKREAVA